jgi:Zn-dependent protease with chaperone function
MPTVFERFTDQARDAIVQAREEARRLGDRTIDPGHMLVGLLAVDDSIGRSALTRLGVAAPPSEATRPLAAPAEPTDYIPFGPDTRAALEGALRESIAHGSRTITTGHLLLGIVAHRATGVDRTSPRVDPAPASVGLTAARLGLAAAGSDVDAVRAAVRQEHADGIGRETGGNGSPRIWRDLRLGPAPERLPGRYLGIPAMAVAIGWCAVLAVAIAGITWDETGPETFGVAFVLSTMGFGLIAAIRTKRAINKQLARAPLAFDPPEEVIAALARRGLTAQVRVPSGWRIRDRCYRWRSNAWIVLALRTIERPELCAFVVAHEVAHLVRNDRARQWAIAILGPAVLISAYITLDPRAWLIAFGGVIGYQVAIRWWTELACDRFAVRWTGAAAFRAWAKDHRTLLRQPQNRRWRRRIRRVFNLLTHPPLVLREAVHRRSA